MNKQLKDLAFAVIETIKKLDVEMKLPSSLERAKRIASITNELEMANDKVLHFALGYSFKKISRLKNRGSKEITDEG
jgi:hypothetical protein